MKSLSLTFALAACLVAPALRAEEGDKETVMKLGEDGKITATAPKEWKSKKPAINFIQYEFQIPKVEGDEADGRVTVMGAGGSIDQNIDRWVAQFQDDAGKPLAKDKTKIEKTKINGLQVHVVDLAGTYKDAAGGPFAGGKTTLRENYRMLGVIVEGGDQGNYFIKAYGPKKTMDANQKAFMTMVEGIKAK
jgi:hypothetical protein